MRCFPSGWHRGSCTSIVSLLSNRLTVSCTIPFPREKVCQSRDQHRIGSQTLYKVYMAPTKYHPYPVLVRSVRSPDFGTVSPGTLSYSSSVASKPILMKQRAIFYRHNVNNPGIQCCNSCEPSTEKRGQDLDSASLQGAVHRTGPWRLHHWLVSRYCQQFILLTVSHCCSAADTKSLLKISRC